MIEKGREALLQEADEEVGGEGSGIFGVCGRCLPGRASSDVDAHGRAGVNAMCDLVSQVAKDLLSDGDVRNLARATGPSVSAKATAANLFDRSPYTEWAAPFPCAIEVRVRYPRTPPLP